MQKKRRITRPRNPKNWDDLPYDLIIMIIKLLVLTRRDSTIMSHQGTLKTFWGVFKKDFKRRIYYLGYNIWIRNYYTEGFKIVSYKQLLTLTMVHPRDAWSRILFTKNPKLRFDKLERLRLVTHAPRPLTSLVGENYNPMPKLKNVSIENQEHFTDAFFHDVKNHRDVEKIKLYILPMVTGLGWGLYLKLKIFEADFCHNLENDVLIQHKKTLEQLIVKECPLIDFKELGKWSFSNLRVLTIHEFRSTRPIAFVQQMAPMFDPVLMNMGDGDIFENGDMLPKLESVTLESIHSLIGTKQWSQKHYQNLKSLVLRRCIKLTDSFFQNGGFQGLKFLDLHEIPLITGFDWDVKLSKSGWTNLMELEISSCKSIKDILFQTNFFPQLKVLKLQFLPLLTGDNWNSMPNLTKLEISYCKAINDTLFQNNLFPKLKYLRLSDLPLLTGDNWNPMSNLTEIYMYEISSQVLFFVRMTGKSSLKLLF